MSKANNEALDAQSIAGILNQSGSSVRSFSKMTLGIVIAAGLAVVLTILVPMLPRSLRFRAEEIVKLLPDATPIDVDSNGRSFGDVVFTLPEPKGPRSRIEEVWTTAGYPTSLGWMSGPGPVPTPAVRTHRSRWAPLPSSPFTTAKSKSKAGAGPTVVAHPATTATTHILYATVEHDGEYIYDEGSARVRLWYDKVQHRYHFQRVPRDPGSYARL